MNYPLRVKKKKRYTGRKIIAMVVVCLIFSFFGKSFIIQTLSYISNSTSSGISFLLPQGFRSASELARENQDLKNQIQILASENADRNALLVENTDLKLRFGRVNNKKTVYATVIQKPPFSPYDTFMLDVGSESGIHKDDTVVFGSLAIGTILEVGKGYAKAELFSSPGKVFEGTLGNNNIKIEARGVGNGSFESFVPINTSVSVGDTIILPAISSKVFGIVQKTEDLEAEGFKKILFALPVNPNQIGAVSVILSDL